MKIVRLKNSMLAKLVLLISLLTIIPLLILGSVSYYVSGNILKQELKASAAKALDKMVSNIDLSLHDVAGIAGSLSDSSQILSDLQQSGAVSESVKNDKYSQLLRSIKTSSNFPIQVMIIDSSGVLHYDDSFLGNVIPKNILLTMNDKITSSAWYKSLFKYDANLQWLGPLENYDSENGSKTLLYMAKNITDGNTYVGTIIIGLEEYFISKQLNNALISPESSVFLLDDTGNIVLSSEDSNESLRNMFTGMQQGELKKQLDSGIVKAGNVSFIVNLNDFSYFGWQLVQLTPDRSLYNKFYYIGNMTILLVLACAALIVVAMFLLKRDLVEPVSTLSKAMKKVQKGDLSIRSALVRSDEIGILSDGFNSMVGEINNLIVKIKAEEKVKREMEFKMLQAQIKPHFLYNALNSIKWMADIKSQRNISKAVTTLVKMLEYNMNDRSVFVTLRQEMEYLSWYIHLSNIRYGNTFDCTYDIEEELYDTYIIKLLLQPIVENAISHGICGISGRGLVSIACHRQGQDMKITITDNGRGIDAETLQRIRLDLLTQGPRKSAPGGMGIPNISDRLKVEYGSQYMLTIDSAPDSGTRVELLAPILTIIPGMEGMNETADS